MTPDLAAKRKARALNVLQTLETFVRSERSEMRLELTKSSRGYFVALSYFCRFAFNRPWRRNTNFDGVVVLRGDELARAAAAIQRAHVEIAKLEGKQP